MAILSDMFWHLQHSIYPDMAFHITDIKLVGQEWQFHIATEHAVLVQNSQPQGMAISYILTWWKTQRPIPNLTDT